MFLMFIIYMFFLNCHQSLAVLKVPDSICNLSLSSTDRLDFIKKIGVCLLKSPNRLNFRKSQQYCRMKKMILMLPIHPMIYNHKFIKEEKKQWISLLPIDIQNLTLGWKLNSLYNDIIVKGVNRSSNSDRVVLYDPNKSQLEEENIYRNLPFTCIKTVFGWWTAWSHWSSCTHTCNGGLQTRRRSCKNFETGYYCVGWPIDLQGCMTVRCPETLNDFHSVGVWSNWQNWLSCSKVCGFGSKQRKRVCSSLVPCLGSDSEWEPCHLKTCPIHGQWVRWEDWTKCGLFQCSISSNLGRKWRSRKCTSPRPRYGGLTCSGEAVETAECGEWECQKYLVTASGGCEISCRL
ncbi:unnamed protein product [Dimorphilus gyrociliatus]|uniref:Uncharacterized protein n=1 Tax=Dimorphilus gyrociliatus TaxID=2664684 RepID=A0A7I8W130_9ANNE|nr:unnamed protein product [Dimorphilus gyrociliatus]